MLRVLKERNLRPSVPDKVIAQNWRRENFPDRQKLKKFITIKQAL